MKMTEFIDALEANGYEFEHTCFTNLYGIVYDDETVAMVALNNNKLDYHKNEEFKGWRADQLAYLIRKFNGNNIFEGVIEF